MLDLNPGLLEARPVFDPPTFQHGLFSLFIPLAFKGVIEGGFQGVRGVICDSLLLYTTTLDGHLYK